jgi:hypothetical protein
MVPTGIEPWEESLSFSAHHVKGKVSYLKLADIMARVTVRVGQNLIDFVIRRQKRRGTALNKVTWLTVVKATEMSIPK